MDMEEDKKDRLEKLEDDYPGIKEQIKRFAEAMLPICLYCGSDDTANVQVGIIGRTIALAGQTRKFHLIPNGPRPGSYFCNSCKKYFDLNGIEVSSNRH